MIVAWRARHINDGPHMWEYYLPTQAREKSDTSISQDLTLRQLLDILNDDRHANAQERPPEPHAPTYLEEAFHAGWRMANTAGMEDEWEDAFSFWSPVYLPPPHAAISKAAARVLTERERQMSSEGWTHEHDDQHDHAEMAKAALSYLAAAIVTEGLEGKSYSGKPPFDNWSVFGWPWASEWWKPGSTRRMLEKASALIIAEIERLDRAEESANA